MTFRKFPYYCVLFIVTLSTLFLSCNNLLLEKKNADFSVQITMPPAYSTTAGSDPLTGGDISTEAPVEKWNLIAWVEEEGNPEHLSPQTISAMPGEIKKINFEKIDVNLKVRVCMTLESSEGKVIYKGESKWFVTQPGTNKISLELVKVPVDALEPVIKNQSKEVYITEDNETVDLFIEAYSPDGGTLSFIWEKQVSPDVWERVSMSQSVDDDGNGTFKSTIEFTTEKNNTEIYRCIVTNTNINATGNKFAATESVEITVKYVKGELISFTAEYIEGAYILMGETPASENIIITEIYRYNNEDEPIDRTDETYIKNNYLIEKDNEINYENAIGYVPYTIINNALPNKPVEIHVPVKYQLSSEELKIIGTPNTTEWGTEKTPELVAQYTGEANLKVVNNNESLIPSCIYESVGSEGTDYDMFSSGVDIVWSKGTKTTDSTTVNVDNTTDGQVTYTASLSPKSEHYWCIGNNSVSLNYYVKVCPWEIKIKDGKGTDYCTEQKDNLLQNTTYVLVLENDASTNDIFDITWKVSNDNFTITKNTEQIQLSTLENTSEKNKTATITASVDINGKETEIAEIKVTVPKQIEGTVLTLNGNITDKDGNVINDTQKVSYTNGENDVATITINEINKEADIWQYCATTNAFKFEKENNYKVYISMSATNETVVGIAAARSDMFFTVGNSIKTYEFETGVLQSDLEKEITIGVAATDNTILSIEEIVVEKISDSNLPTLSVMVSRSGIESYLSDTSHADDIVTINNKDEEYEMVFNSTGVTLQMRDLDLSSNSIGLNKVSFDITSTNKDLETSLYATTNNPKINTWNGIKTSLNTTEPKNLNVLFPIYEGDSNYTLGILSESNVKASIDISNLEVGVVSKDNISTAMNSNGKVFAIKTGDNWVKQNNLPISTTTTLKEKNSIVVFDVLLINEFDSYPGENNEKHWDDCIRFLYSESNCSILKNKLSYYKDKDTDGYDRFNIKNDSDSEITCRITLTDDFTVLIEEVTDTNNDSSSSGGTSDNGIYNPEGNEVPEIISDQVNGLSYVSINEVEGVYIYSEEGLDTYRKMINNELDEDVVFTYNSGYSTKSFDKGTPHYLNGYLKSNIILTNDWTPIGTSDHPFAASFDGQGHTITINSISSEADVSVGLFGNIQGATISNLTVVSEGTILSTATNVGAIAGSGYGTIINCVNEMAITQNPSKEQSYLGGIIGNANNSQTNISGCVNKGILSGSTNVGGIAGYSVGSTIENCVNFAKVTGTNNIGGIVGYYYQAGTVSKCINFGNIVSDSSEGYQSGIVGSLDAQSNTNAIISDCINFGEINSKSVVSGIVFDSYQWIQNSGPSVSVSNCINVGTMKGTSVYAIANEGIESDCYYDNQQITGSNLLDSNYVTGKSSEEICKLNQSDLFSDWSFDTNRYPLPNLSNVFTQTIWDEIVTAANTSGTN